MSLILFLRKIITICDKYFFVILALEMIFYQDKYL